MRLQGPEPVVGPNVTWADKLRDSPRPIRLTFRRKLPPAGADAAAAMQSSAVPCANPAQPAPLKSAKSAPSMCEWSPFIDVEHVTESTGVQFSTVSPSDCTRPDGRVGIKHDTATDNANRNERPKLSVAPLTRKGRGSRAMLYVTWRVVCHVARCVLHVTRHADRCYRCSLCRRARAARSSSCLRWCVST